MKNHWHITSKINFLPDDHTLFGLIRRHHTSQSIVLNLFQWCTDLIQKFPSNYYFQGCPAGRKNITMKVIFTSTQKNWRKLQQDRTTKHYPASNMPFSGGKWRHTAGSMEIKKNIDMSCWVEVKLKNLDSNAVERSLLLRSPMGQKNLAILTGDRINEDFFFTRKCTAVLLMLITLRA